MKLPKSFQLAGIKWSVQFVEGIVELGRCDRDSAQIILRKGLSPEITASVFCHELVHAITFTMGVTDQDEKTIDAFGYLLHQFLTTARS